MLKSKKKKTFYNVNNLYDNAMFFLLSMFKNSIIKSLRLQKKLLYQFDILLSDSV